MKIFVAGSGKLATALLSELELEDHQVTRWEDHKSPMASEKAIVIHAGSGRQLDEIMSYCSETKSTLIELSTGLKTESIQTSFTLVVCPNVSLLLLKTMYMMQKFGHHFDYNEIKLVESHQSTKQSTPGTAFHLADSLQLPREKITSIRNPKDQQETYHIPEEYLGGHAFHQITISDGSDEVRIETTVLGHSSYVRGVKRVLEAVTNHELEPRSYSILEMIDQNWL
ncbi:dihydrodipicolinate reductase C-terminal domain-containing protein [Marinoscillum sp.]|uniref:dihydrodipicolinate reductase C-terminal domain-containing protein n=1 Tax=Marinoscillum sp. TaxID=2024838 RepID=UPI003BAB1535